MSNEELTEKEAENLLQEFSRALCVSLTGSDELYLKHKKIKNGTKEHE
jgi:hypothetical protein